MTKAFDRRQVVQVVIDDNGPLATPLDVAIGVTVCEKHLTNRDFRRRQRPPTGRALPHPTPFGPECSVLPSLLLAPFDVFECAIVAELLEFGFAAPADEDA